MLKIRRICRFTVNFKKIYDRNLPPILNFIVGRKFTGTTGGTWNLLPTKLWTKGLQAFWNEIYKLYILYNNFLESEMEFSALLYIDMQCIRLSHNCMRMGWQCPILGIPKLEYLLTYSNKGSSGCQIPAHASSLVSSSIWI